MFHDAGCALGAYHSLVQGMLRVALDVAHFAISQGDANAATAGAHITGCVFDFDAAVSDGRSCGGILHTTQTFD